ncbi:MAG: flavodoxin domain-containing protein [Chloracidobacterium sp.]|nr:flavodoxin domain-containing protein [Chloracidobacterium sp.]
MKIALLYGSSHGRTRKAVNESLERLTIKPDVFDVKDLTSTEQFSVYDILMFFCPTYGDEELQPDMEKFITDFSLDMSGKQFVICELGNYYGYEDFSFGAMQIIRRHLLELGGRELCSPLSLDAMPRVEWNQLRRWIEYVNGNLNNHV